MIDELKKELKFEKNRAKALEEIQKIQKVDTVQDSISHLREAIRATEHKVHDVVEIMYEGIAVRESHKKFIRGQLKIALKKS